MHGNGRETNKDKRSPQIDAQIEKYLYRHRCQDSAQYLKTTEFNLLISARSTSRFGHYAWPQVVAVNVLFSRFSAR